METEIERLTRENRHLKRDAAEAACRVREIFDMIGYREDPDADLWLGPALDRVCPALGIEIHDRRVR